MDPMESFTASLLELMVKFGTFLLVEFIRQLPKGQIPKTFYFRLLSITKISTLECCRFGKIPEVTFQAIIIFKVGGHFGFVKDNLRLKPTIAWKVTSGILPNRQHSKLEILVWESDRK